VGANYEMGPQLQALTPFKNRINIFSGMKIFLDGKPVQVHNTQTILGGGILPGNDAAPTIDSLIADVIGTRTRFRSLEVSCDGTGQSQSRRGGSVVNPAETSPAALYTRIFGAEFKDPNAADFTPDTGVMVRRSALSAVTEEREAYIKGLGAGDKTRLDEYFTSLRELEQQLDIQLQKPAPLEACTIPSKADDGPVSQVMDDAIATHKLFAGLLAHALACGQTRVVNVNFGGALSNLRRAGSAMTFHMYSHEEPIDPKLGYQEQCTWFQGQCVEQFKVMLTVLDSIKEGSGTLLDRMLVFYPTDHGYAKIHGVENIPMLTAGNAGGRIKTGIHVSPKGDSVTRVGLTIQQALGVPINSWGTASNQTTRTITEIIA
jgi:hypothetical protein